MTTARITVHLKQGISDPEAQNTEKALHLLGFGHVMGVHTTKVWEIDLGKLDPEAAREEAERMCRRLLTNPVLHTYQIDVV